MSMNNLLSEKLRNVTLTKGQEKIAHYFLRNQRRIGSLSSMEAAKEIGVSDASIIRFARAIGYEGFADMKEDFYAALVENAYANLSLEERMRQSQAEHSGRDVQQEFLSVMEANLLGTMRDNDPAQFDQAEEYLLGAKRRYIIGLRGCRGVASQFSRLLSFMLPGVRCIIDSECVSINALQDAEENDVVLMFVFARYYKIDIDYLELAKKRGVKVCLVTDEVYSPLTAYADVILQAEKDHMSFFNSCIGALTIGEYLLTRLGQKVEFKERMEMRDELTQYQRLS